MFARIRSEGIDVCSCGVPVEENSVVWCMTEQEWEERSEFRDYYGFPHEKQWIHFCKMEIHSDYAIATFCIPPKRENEVGLTFMMYIVQGKLLFIDNGTIVENQIYKLSEKKQQGKYSMGLFLYDFLTGLLEEDLLFIQEMEREISAIEEMVLKGCCPGFNVKMLVIKKKISKFCRYYTQLAELGQELYDNCLLYFEEPIRQKFESYRERAARLAGETQILRDYAMQVQDVYQSEISIRQNDVMKMLTVVTTIFLPLTLIAGWYGMNFVYMPELGMRYAYPMVIGISIIIVVLSLIIFKKKRYW